MPSEGVVRFLGCELACRLLDRAMENRQAAAKILDSYPDDAGRTLVGKEPDVFRAHLQWRETLAGKAKGVRQCLWSAGLNVSQESQCEVKLLALGPTHNVTHHRLAKLLLGLFNGSLDFVWQKDRNEKPQMLWILELHGPSIVVRSIGSGQWLAAGRNEQTVPFFSGQLELIGFCSFADAFGIN